MNPQTAKIARDCLAGSADGTLAFPQVVATLADAGIESYSVDFRRRAAIYYSNDGDSIALEAHAIDTPIAPALDEAALRAAIGEAQRLAPGYTYRGFCEKAAAAGCAFYVVSMLGRRAVYAGRDGGIHIEHFP